MSKMDVDVRKHLRKKNLVIAQDFQGNSVILNDDSPKRREKFAKAMRKAKGVFTKKPKPVGPFEEMANDAGDAADMLERMT